MPECGLGAPARAYHVERLTSARVFFVGGGCVLPLTQSSPVGRDCTAIQGVADVACMSGECVVRRCLKGFTPSTDGARCNPEYPATSESQPDITGADLELELVPASIYGLEHIPLERN